MTEVYFYHLTETTLDEVLPGLLERCLARGWKAVVQTSSDERRDALDAALWTYRVDSFLAHGTDREPHAGEQPVLLTAGDGNPSGAEARFLVDGAMPASLDGYARASVFFDGHDAAQLDGARAQWKTLKEAGHDVTYWQQTPDRRWEKKA